MSEQPGDERDNLSDIVYQQLKSGLLRAQFKPHQRFKVRQLAQDLGTSETPVREALMQLSREGAIEIKPRFYIRVRRLTLAEYNEIRAMRLVLEPLAAEHALTNISDETITRLETIHQHLTEAERMEDWRAALQINSDFHFTLYKQSQMAHLIDVLESLWIRVGPLVSELYPTAKPSYPGRHQHEKILTALSNRDSYALRLAVQLDLIEGGAALLKRLQQYEQDNPCDADRSALNSNQNF
ncbi:GntR family transcriptional regulator [Brucella tritici]|uniref:GntR family transcriptional regulator n=1 Tax=Brucella tritici TaxID=94626 RepID=A0A7X6JCU5_9HYPH|nr:GntR family transcriptional regulator [Brucella tritici]KAB2663765.1 GntR family transcriptional regulator [Brucella tritici]NKW10471.1 GntR family transcriptional regulator [Brucella tritici]